MAELTNVTTLVNGDVFDPQVVSDMINAKVEKKAVMTGYIKVDNTLSGVPGSTVTVPRWGYIGEAVDLEEGQNTLTIDLPAGATAEIIFSVIDPNKEWNIPAADITIDVAFN